MIVLVHGVPETAAVWEPVAAGLGEPVVRLSPPGFGAPVPPGWTAPLTAAEQTVAALRRFWGSRTP